MNNHIKTCPYCQGDGVVTKDWDDIVVGDKVNCYGANVTVIKLGEKTLYYGDEYWVVHDGEHTFNMFYEGFGGFVKD